MKIDNILKYIIYGALFLILFIPFIVIDNTFFPFIAGKGFAFRILVELMVGLWAILALRNSEYRPKFSWILGLTTIFVLIIGVADMFGDYPMKSIWSNYERMEGWITLIHLLGFLIVSISVLQTEKLWHRFFNVSIFASVLMSFYGLLQLANVLETHQGSRLDATLGNSAYLAVYMLVHIFLTLFLFLRSEKGSFIRWIYGGAMVLQTIVLYNTATRGAILGLIGGLIITSLFVVFFEKENKKLKKISIGGLLGLILVVTLFIGFKDTSFVKNSNVLNRFATISFEEGTTKARFMVWNMALQGFKEKPILGWGQENFNYVFNKYYDPGMYEQEQWFDRTHNVFFDWLIAGGLLGLLGYLSLFIALIYYIFIDKNLNFSPTEKGVLLGMLSAYFIHNFFVFDHLISYILFFSILGYIHNLNQDEEKIILSENVNEKFNKIAIPIIIVATVFSFYFVNAKGVLANVNLLKGLIPHQEGVDKNLDYFEKAISYDSFGNQEIREQLAQMVNKAATVNIDNEIKNKILNLAYTEMMKQIEEDPENARLQVILGTSLASAGLYDDALIHLKRALELSPNKQGMMTIIGNVYNIKGQYSEGLIYFEKAFKLDESFNEIRNQYAVSAIYNGNSKLVEEILVPVYGSVLVDDIRIIQAYFVTKQYDKTAKILEQHLRDKPNDTQQRLSLASVYIELGLRTKAIEEIQKVIEINPDFKDQGEYYINEIKAGRKP